MATLLDVADRRRLAMKELNIVLSIVLSVLSVFMPDLKGPPVAFSNRIFRPPVCRPSVSLYVILSRLHIKCNI